MIKDDVVSAFFTEAISLDLDTHLPIIVNFWSSILLYDMSYKGNVMMKHIELHRIKKLEKEHFERWLAIWKKHVDNLYSGPNAEMAKKRAQMMMQLMMVKVKNSEQKGFIQ